jgi:hypothetical protein
MMTATMADSTPNVELHTPNNVLKNSIDPTYAASTQTIAGSEPQASPVGLPIPCLLLCVSS